MYTEAGKRGLNKARVIRERGRLLRGPISTALPPASAARGDTSPPLMTSTHAESSPSPPPHPVNTAVGAPWSPLVTLRFPPSSPNSPGELPGRSEVSTRRLLLSSLSPQELSGSAAKASWRSCLTERSRCGFYTYVTGGRGIQMLGSSSFG